MQELLNSLFINLQKKNMQVKLGEKMQIDPWEEARQEKQEYRLREKMIKKKHRKLYRSMMKGREDRAKEIWLLRKKRRIHDTNEKEKRKTNWIEDLPEKNAWR